MVTMMVQVRMKQLEAMSSSRLSILLIMDLVLVRKMLRCAGLLGHFLSLACSPEQRPRFCFRSLLVLLHLLGKHTVH